MSEGSWYWWFTLESHKYREKERIFLKYLFTYTPKMLPNAPKRTVADLCDSRATATPKTLHLLYSHNLLASRTSLSTKSLRYQEKTGDFPSPSQLSQQKDWTLLVDEYRISTDTSLGNRSTHTKGNNDGYPCPSPPRGHHTGNDAGIVENGGSQAVISVLTWVECRGRIDWDSIWNHDDIHNRAAHYNKLSIPVSVEHSIRVNRSIF
jgi:hypothetical protein